MKALKNHIIFKFVDQVNSKGEFVRKETSFGLTLLAGFDNSAKTPRWATVVAIGPDVKDVVEGDQILLPALRWTERVAHDGGPYWKTHETEVVCRRDPAFPSKVTPLNSFLLFKPDVKADAVNQTASGLLFVGVLDDNTPTGTVLQIAAAVESDLAGAKIYYSGDNFFDNVDDHVDVPFSFIKEEGILAYEIAE